MLMANITYSRTNKEPRQNDSFNPTFRRQGPELIALTYAAMGRKDVHS